METLKFNFSHPVKGNAFLINCSNCKDKKTLPIDTRNSAALEIPVINCSDGNWRIVLEWEFDGRTYHYEQDFLVKSNHICLKTS